MADFRERCKKFFKEADLDGKGTLSKIELYKIVNKSGCKKTPDEIVDLFQEMDTNKDDEVNLDEFLKALCKIPPKEVKEADLRAAFKKFDRDGSGFITLDELKTVLSEQGVDPDTAVLDMDRDKDGKVKFDEFLAAFRDS